jgi:hypothetical protein
MTLDGPFAVGTNAVMKTRAGRTHKMVITAVQPGRSFRLETSAIPGTRFRFSCAVVPAPNGGTTLSQGLTMSGPLAFIVSPMTGNKIAQEFGPILDGLAHAAETGG